ncbi:MAG TPA: pitrilysin family protein [Syntrophorhabdaceae bacterium]|nr:pitrilysin family protein [Syntrophorhabdaceae bacterium]HPU29682.1 pitrilysin family protein [Syntrophorhabdaceae bacterium]
MYRKTVLQNGLTIVTESIPYFSSISIGLWWKTGSRYEDASTNGISHFIEHMLFKGTDKRTAYDIAREIDAIGGTINAFTGKEYTCLFAKVLKKDMDIAIDVLSDMYKNSLFKEDDMDREKYVIAQEIKMVEDNPEEYIFDLFNASYFNNHPLGMTILGTHENIERFSRDNLIEHFKRYYNPKRLVITATGRVDHNNFVNKIKKAFDDLDVCEDGQIELIPPEPQNHVNYIERDLEHTYICLGTKGLSQIDDKRYALYALNAIIGGSASSHLFQEVREKRGLVYNIYSYVSCFKDTGTFGISTSTSEENVLEVMSILKEEILRIKKEGITDNDLEFSKDHIKGNLFMSLESSDARMGRLAKNEIYFDGYIPLKETIREIDMIEKKDINGIIDLIFDDLNNISITILGKADIKAIKSIWKD